MCIVCVLTWSLLGVKKSLGYAQIGLFQGFYSKFPTSIPTPFICGEPPPPLLGETHSDRQQLYLLAKCGVRYVVTKFRVEITQTLLASLVLSTEN